MERFDATRKKCAPPKFRVKIYARTYSRVLYAMHQERILHCCLSWPGLGGKNSLAAYLSTGQPLSGLHGNRTHGVLSQVLRYLKHQPGVSLGDLHLMCIVTIRGTRFACQAIIRRSLREKGEDVRRDALLHPAAQPKVSLKLSRV